MIRSGVALGDRSGDDGTQSAMPGSKVNVKQGKIDFPRTAAAATSLRAA